MLDVLIFAAFVMSQPSYQVVQRFFEPIVMLVFRGSIRPVPDPHCLSTRSLDLQLKVCYSAFNFAPFR